MRRESRDNQRKRVYRVEWTYLAEYQPELLSEEKAREFSNLVDPEVKFVRTHGSAAKAFYSTKRIRMSKPSMYKILICHEIAHTHIPLGYASHGPEFVNEYLKLIAEFIGEKEYKLFRVFFKIANVKWFPLPIIPYKEKAAASVPQE